MSPPPPALKTGDAAPRLQTGKWLQDETVTEISPGKTYLVEFWATWCGPCRVSIPHLDKLRRQYQDKGLIVIGQDCWERDEELVAPFIKSMAGEMTYRIALDDKSGSPRGSMAENWMAAAGRDSIPSAFLVDANGRIAWIGHPMEITDQMIEEVLAGTFDQQKAAAKSAQQDSERLLLLQVMTMLVEGRRIVGSKLPKLDTGYTGPRWYDVLPVYVLMREAGEVVEGNSSS